MLSRHVISLVRIAGVFPLALLAAPVVPTTVNVPANVPGRIVFAGHEIAPPYRLSYTNGKIIVNDLAVVRPRSDRERPTRSAAAVPAQAGSPHHLLNKSTSRLRDSLVSLGLTHDVILQRIARAYVGSPLVDSAWVTGANAIAVQWLGDASPEHMRFGPQTSNASPIDLDEIRQSRLQTIRARLAGGCLIFISGSDVTTVPPGRLKQVRAEMARHRRSAELMNRTDVLPRTVINDLKHPPKLHRLLPTTQPH